MDSKNRFSDRVENYVKFRPRYPVESIDFLLENGIRKYSKICDIGSGTGILTKQLLERDLYVIGVEPNDEMRIYAERLLNSHEKFRSVSGSAEETTLSDKSVDTITAAQAFHWFDKNICRKEFSRILKNKGTVFLIWNRRDNTTKLLKDYDELLKKYGTDYRKLNHQNLTDSDFSSFFYGSFGKEFFPNYQELDWDGFLGRAMSASYTPNTEHPLYPEFHDALESLFEKYEKAGLVRIEYKTEIVYGSIE